MIPAAPIRAIPAAHNMSCRRGLHVCRRRGAVVSRALLKRPMTTLYCDDGRHCTDETSRVLMTALTPNVVRTFTLMDEIVCASFVSADHIKSR